MERGFFGGCCVGGSISFSFWVVVVVVYCGLLFLLLCSFSFLLDCTPNINCESPSLPS